MTPAKFSILLLAALACSASPRLAPAQTNPASSAATSTPSTVAPQTALPTAKVAPDFATRFLPQESRSLLWARVPPQPATKPLGLHLYALSAEELRKGGLCHFVLDVVNVPQPLTPVVPGDKVDKRRGKPKRPLANRVLFSTVFPASPTAFDFAVAWTTPSHDQPVLRIRSFLKGDVPGDSTSRGIEHFVTFPQGWKNPASVCNLPFGPWGTLEARETNRLLVGTDQPPTIEAILTPLAPLASVPPAPVPSPPATPQSFVLRWNEEAEAFRPLAGQAALIQRYFRPFQ